MVTPALIALLVPTAVWAWLALSPVGRAGARARLDAAPTPPTPPTTPTTPGATAAITPTATTPATSAAPTSPPTALASCVPSVTVIVPARNEADVLPATLPTILAQQYPGIGVVVVDDQSDDATPAVLDVIAAHHPNLLVVRGRERPAGWCGKPWAVRQAVDRAGNAAWLVLTDADILFHPAAVTRAVSLATDRGLDLLSVFPRPTFGAGVGGFVEALGVSGLWTILALLFPMARANDPRRRRDALAAGGFMLVRRTAYDAVGGHAAVRDQLVEDVALARALKAAGFAVGVRQTTDLLTTRMYDGPADLWEGLAKNAYAGMGHRPHKFLFGAPAALAFVVLAPAYVAWAAAAVAVAVASNAPSRGAAAVLAVAIALVAFQAIVHARTVRLLRLPAWHALLLPAAVALYAAAAGCSFWRHHFGRGNVWKGRRYDRRMFTAADAAPPPSTIRLPAPTSPPPPHCMMPASPGDSLDAPGCIMSALPGGSPDASGPRLPHEPPAASIGS